MSIALGWMRYATRLFRLKPTLGKQVGKFRQPDAVSSKGQVEATPSDLQMIMNSLAQSLRICGYLLVLRADDWSLDEIADFMSGCEVCLHRGTLSEASGSGRDLP
ncbi:hypothetical protein FOZ61_006558, partial [Perkinsus olseni]